MRKMIHSILVAATLLTVASAAMAAPRRVHHYHQYPYSHFSTNSSDSAYRFWDQEADH